MRNYDEIPETTLTTAAAPASEEAFTRKPLLKPHLYNDTLLEILGLTPEMVEVNRRGRLTAAQQAVVQGELKNDADGVYLLVTIFLGVALLLSFIFLSQGLPMLYLVIGAALMLGGLMFYSYRRQQRLRDDITLKVEKTQGAMQLYQFPNMIGRYALIINQQLFPISAEAYEQLSAYDLPPCRVYYSARSKTLLSAEVLPQYEVDKLKHDLALEDEAPEMDEKRKRDDLLAEDLAADAQASADDGRPQR